MDMNTIHTCDTCRHHPGGGCCRINLEAECGKGEFEAWEPRMKEPGLMSGDIPGYVYTQYPVKNYKLKLRGRK